MSISILRSFPVRNGWILLNANRIQLPSTAVVGTPVACKLKLNTRVVSTANPTNSAHSVAFENHQIVVPPIPFYDEGERFLFNCPRVREVPDEDEVQRIEDVDLYMITGKESETKLKKRLKFEAYFRKCHPNVQAKLEPLRELFINLTTKSCRPRLLDFELCHDLFSRMGDLSDEETAVIVLYPGPGIVTSELVKLGAKNVYAFEPIRGFYDHLKKLHANDLVTVHNRELVTIEDHVGRKMNGPFNHILNQENIKNVKIITSSGQRNTIKSTLISMLPCITPSSKNIEIYTMAPSLISKEILGKEKDVTRSMYKNIWSIFMEDELCHTMSVETFYPPIKKTMVNHKNPRVSVIRSTVKQLPYKARQFQESDGLYLIAFTSQFKASSCSSVVGTLEKWSPGIGALLIKKGIRVFTPFNQLTPEQYLNVFFTFLDYTTNESTVWDVLNMQKDNLMTEIDARVEGINNMLYHSN